MRRVELPHSDQTDFARDLAAFTSVAVDLLSDRRSQIGALTVQYRSVFHIEIRLFKFPQIVLYAYLSCGIF